VSSRRRGKQNSPHQVSERRRGRDGAVANSGSPRARSFPRPAFLVSSGCPARSRAGRARARTARGRRGTAGTAVPLLLCARVTCSRASSSDRGAAGLTRGPGGRGGFDFVRCMYSFRIPRNHPPAGSASTSPPPVRAGRKLSRDVVRRTSAAPRREVRTSRSEAGERSSST